MYRDKCLFFFHSSFHTHIFLPILILAIPVSIFKLYPTLLKQALKSTLGTTIVYVNLLLIA